MKLQKNNINELEVIQINLFNIKEIINVTRIIYLSGKNMAKNSNLHHWDNSFLKTFLIVILCFFKNKVFLLKENSNYIATFQTRIISNVLLFEKLAVIPTYTGKGYGSTCLKIIESMCKQLGIKKSTLEVYEKSESAINFYLNNGYIIVDNKRTLKYKNIIMEKKIK